MLQGVFALNHLIVFGGDSAGGHLSLSLMAHLHRLRPTDLTIESSINWHGTFSADVLNRKVVDEWGVYLVDNSPLQEEISGGNGWGLALDVPEAWWENVSAVDHILVTGGYEEVFSDHIQRLGTMLKKKGERYVTLYMANEAHDGLLMDFAAGICPSETTKSIADFVIACFMK
ncbi:uncharacterized protein KD926_005320 [Aspergillus affinis]|uniref:uncharacterized protein n=1 Tax=Aspergillus affinis TaxID=1070780 RepID=UPI0022FF16DF|nr:uncharacterized protein KD926_005320 [Aspergillus affinis]KAI9034845.1 hypothetical protein KD926_005320 [Aspergillus affinis]